MMKRIFIRITGCGVQLRQRAPGQNRVPEILPGPGFVNLALRWLIPPLPSPKPVERRTGISQNFWCAVGSRSTERRALR